MDRLEEALDFLVYDYDDSIADADSEEEWLDEAQVVSSSRPGPAPQPATLMSTSSHSSTIAGPIPSALLDDVASGGGGGAAADQNGHGSRGGGPRPIVARSALSATAGTMGARPLPIGSLPVRALSASGAMQMATSVPVPVPTFRGWLNSAGAAKPASGAPAAREPFVPPHQLLARDDFGLDPNGGSPSACIKRDRLRMRNCVLRSTGFLET